jgi:Tol biopolymer transport system component/tRNA A-37 threonylcarbamoyl transferase component Bud32
VAQDADSVDPATGGDELRRVGTFEILDEIGRGGMGVVYRARDTKLQRVVALKRPKQELLDRPDLRRRFMTEARSASKLMHPHITTVFEVFEDDSVPWLVMELIDGASLRSMLEEGDPLPCEEVLRHAEGLTDALRAAHTGGVLHRDINPNNILIGADGRARLSDFGLAGAWVASETSPGISAESTKDYSSDRVGGTRGYTSPEQALGRPIDPRSDIFSLGAVLYEMCSGRPAFLRKDSSDWMDLLLHREPEPISSINSEVPIEFEQIVHKALAKRPFQRYQSANEMLLDLRAVKRKLSTDTGSSATSFELRRRRRNRWIGIGVAALTLAAVAFVLNTVMSRAPGDPMLLQNHRRLTTAAGWEGEPAVSPDGTMVAYASDQSGNRDIWVVHAAGGEPLQLTNHPGSDSAPTWFPDGTTIAFVSDRDGEPGIWRVPSLSGDPVMLLPRARSPAVAPSGVSIAFTRAGKAGALRVWVAPLDDPARGRALTGDGDGVWNHTDPSWSPDGTSLTYADFGDIWLVEAEGGSPRRLTTDGESNRQPVWSADGKHIYFSSRRDGTLALWRIAADGGEAERVTVGTGGERDPSLDREARFLAYATTDVNTDIMVRDVISGEEFVIGGATLETEPALSHDGSTIAFMSDRRGAFDLWLQSIGDTGLVGRPRQLTDQQGMAALPDFSPDGRWIAYHRAVGGERDIWIIPMTGGEAGRFTEHPAQDIQPAHSPDGTRIAFVSDRSGSFQIWVAPVADGLRGGDPRQITRGNEVHFSPAWSPDGKRLACVCRSETAHEVGIIDLENGNMTAPITVGAGAAKVLWAASGDALLVSGTWGTDRYLLRTVPLTDDPALSDDDIDLGPDDPLAGLFASGGEGRILAYVATRKTGDVWLTEINQGRR